MHFKIIQSPNYSKKTRKLDKIKFLIIHYTGMQSVRASILRLTNLRSKVSCHYLINRNGNIVQMVQDENVAWHAGKSKWKNFKNLNNTSIGIELVNKGHELGYQNFPKKQVRSLIKLIFVLKKKYKIKASNILGHSDIAPIRKIDPGENFPWFKLNKNGLGIHLKNIKIKFFKIKNKKELRNCFFSNLYKIGYRYFNRKKSNSSDKFIVRAFQMRFFQKNVSGLIDQKTFEISHYLANKIKK